MNDGKEWIRAIKEYATQKHISHEMVVKAMERVIRDIEIKKYEYDKLHVTLNDDGKILLERELVVVQDESLENTLNNDGYQCISLKRASKLNSINVQEGDVIREIIPNTSFLRFEIGQARREVFKALNDLIRQAQYDEFKDRVGQIFNFLILRIENGNLILINSGNETILFRNKLIKGELFQKGQHVKVYIEDVVRSDRGSQIIVSRIHKNFVKSLMEAEIPELNDGVVEIKAIARFSGLKTKVAVYSSDTSVDPVGACIGIKGSRISNIISELNGERIDVVVFSANIRTFVKNIFGENNIEKISIDEYNNYIDLVVLNEKISLIIGKGGANVSLASQLIGCKINVMSVEDESRNRMNDFNSKADELMEILDIEKVIAQLLVLSGYDEIEIIQNASVEDLLSIDGFDEDISQELLTRAKDYVAKNIEQNDAKETTVNENTEIDLRKADLENLSDSIIDILYKNNIRNVQDLADLSVDDLDEFVGDVLTEDQKGKIIMSSRSLLGWV